MVLWSSERKGIPSRGTRKESTTVPGSLAEKEPPSQRLGASQQGFPPPEGPSPQGASPLRSRVRPEQSPQAQTQAHSDPIPDHHTQQARLGEEPFALRGFLFPSKYLVFTHQIQRESDTTEVAGHSAQDR